MKASSLDDTASQRRAERRSPFTGCALIFRLQRRGRRPGREVIGVVGMLILLLAGAAGLQSLFFGRISVYSSNEVRFLLRGLTTQTIAAALLLPCAGAILGAGAAPITAEHETIQALLLTRLRPWEIVSGRLLAALWMPLCLLAISLVVWMAAQCGWRFSSGSLGGIGPILAAHAVLLAALLMSGATGFLFALRSRPGRSWERGALLSLLLSLVCVFGLFTLNGPIRRMDNPTTLIEAALLINPVTGVTSALNKDILRVPWIYNRTEAPEYPFLYPSPLATGSVLMLIALGAHTAAAVRLRRSYHIEN